MSDRATGATVQVAGVTKSFSGVDPVLSDIDLDVAAGSTFVLLGPSGCGKTTLLRIISGLERPDSGTISVDGTVLERVPDVASRPTNAADGGRRAGAGVHEAVSVAPERRNIGMVFQDWALFPHLDVARNVGFGLPRSQRRASPRIDEALELVGLEGFGGRMPSTLSGGQQQRVALARAIAPRPSVLLMDEPFSNLDAALRVQVRGEIHELLQSLNITTVFVTHDQDEAFLLGDRVAVLAAGRVVQVGTPAELYQRPSTRWLAGFVGDADFVPGVADGPTADTMIGSIPLVAAADGPIDVLLRPEDVEPITSGSQGAGTVELVEYVGRDTTYRVTVGDISLRARRPSAPQFAAGDRVALRYRGNAAAWFPRATRT